MTLEFLPYDLIILIARELPDYETVINFACSFRKNRRIGLNEKVRERFRQTKTDDEILAHILKSVGKFTIKYFKQQPDVSEYVIIKQKRNYVNGKLRGGFSFRRSSHDYHNDPLYYATFFDGLLDGACYLSLIYNLSVIRVNFLDDELHDLCYMTDMGHTFYCEYTKGVAGIMTEPPWG